MKRPAAVRAFALIALAGAAAGCATSISQVTLLADEPGLAPGAAPSAVAVFDGKTQAEVGALTAANTTTSLGGRKVEARPADPAAYAELTRGLPPPPQHFRLYFLEGTTTLTEASLPAFHRLHALVTPGSYVQIVGYTDTVGSAADNQKLSDRRAQEIKRALVALGLPVQDARTTGRGEHDLAKPTPDNVDEPENRRVEVVLR